MGPVIKTARQMRDIYPDLVRVPAQDKCSGCHFDSPDHCTEQGVGGERFFIYMKRNKK